VSRGVRHDVFIAPPPTSHCCALSDGRVQEKAQRNRRAVAEELVQEVLEEGEVFDTAAVFRPRPKIPDDRALSEGERSNGSASSSSPTDGPLSDGSQCESTMDDLPVSDNEVVSSASSAASSVSEVAGPVASPRFQTSLWDALEAADAMEATVIETMVSNALQATLEEEQDVLDGTTVDELVLELVEAVTVEEEEERSAAATTMSHSHASERREEKAFEVARLDTSGIEREMDRVAVTVDGLESDTEEQGHVPIAWATPKREPADRAQHQLDGDNTCSVPSSPIALTTPPKGTAPVGEPEKTVSPQLMPTGGAAATNGKRRHKARSMSARHPRESGALSRSHTVPTSWLASFLDEAAGTAYTRVAVWDPSHRSRVN